MAQEDIIRRLLIKLGVSTKDFEAGIKTVKDALDKLYAAEKVKQEERKAASAQNVESLQKETQLAKEAADTSAQAVEALKAQAKENRTLVENQQKMISQEKQALELRQASYRMLEAESKISAVTLKNLEKQLDAERAALLVREAIVRAALTGTGGSVRTKPQAESIASSRNVAGAAALQQNLQNAAEATGISGIEAQVAGATKVRALTAEQLEERRKELDISQKELAVEEKTIRLLVQRGAANKEDAEVVLKRIAEKKNELGLEQAQLRLQTAKTGEGLIGQIGEKMSEAVKTITGGGLFGQIAGGAFTGVLGAELFTGVIEKAHELGEALFEASGRAQNLRIEFEKLAEAKEADPSELLNKFRTATHGMVDDTELFNISTKLMRQNMNVTNDQIVRLVGTTIDLARASGKTVPEALSALERASQGGRMQLLAYATGLNIADIRMQQLPKTMDQATKNTIQFNKVLNAETAALIKLGGAPATTLPDLYRQIEAAQKNFIDSIAEGVVSSAGFGATIKDLSVKIQQLMPQIMAFAKTMGKDLADAGKWVADNWGTIKLIFEALVAIKVVDWGTGILGMIVDWKTETASFIELLGELIAKLGVVQTIRRVGGLIGGAGGGVVAGAEEGAGVAVGAAAGGAAGGAVPAIVAALGGFAGIAAIVISVLSAGVLAWLTTREWKREATGGPLEKPSGLRTDTIGKPMAAGLLYYDPTEEAAQKRAQALAPPESALQRTEKPAQLQQVPEANAEVFKQLAQLQLKIDDERLKAKYAALKDELDEEAALQKMYYTAGQTDFETYMAQQAATREKQHKLVMDQLEAERKFALEKITRENRALIDATSLQQKRIEAQMTMPGVSAEQVQALAQESEGLEAQKVQLQDPRVLRKQQEEVNAEFDAKEAAEDAKNNKEKVQLTEQTVAAIRRAYDTLEQEIIRIQKEGATEQLKVLQENFNNGIISANTYLAQRRTLIEQEKTAALAALEEQYNSSTKTYEDQAKLAIGTIQAQIDYQKQLTEVTQQQDKIRLDGATNTYNRMKEFITIQRDVAAATGGVSPQSGAIQVKADQALLSLNEQYMAQLKEQLTLVTAGSAQWFQIQKAIGLATEEQQKLNKEIAQMQDWAGPVASLFSSITSELTKTSGGLGFWLKQMSGILKQMSDFRIQAAQYGGAGGLAQSLGTSALNLFRRVPAHELAKAPVTPEQKLGASTDAMVQKLKQMTDGLQQKFANVLSDQSQKVSDKLMVFGDKLDKATQKLVDFASGGGTDTGSVTGGGEDISGAPGTSTGEGGVAGPSDISGLGIAPSMQASMEKSASALDQLGESAKNTSDDTESMGEKFGDFAKNAQAWVGALAGLIKGLTGGQTAGGGALGGGMAGLSFGSNFGPWGAAIGAAGGAVVGALFGQKNEQIQEMATEFKNRMKGIEDSLNAGTMSLGTAIQSLQQERTDIVNEMSGGKKKENAQLQPILDALNQEISTLQLQQKQALDSLHQQLAILSSPSAFQPFMDQLDQIMQKYQQFASAAAGNTTEMANANRYLTLSLQQYVSTLSDQLNQAQQNAVTDALHLLDIQQQQIDLDNQHQMSVYGALTQGTLVRQRTDAQTRGAQIEAMNQQYSLQKEQLNNEQALTQYKVTAEEKIFGLASDRVSLESQLLVLQEAAYDKSIAQVQALQQAVTQLTNALGPGGIPSSLYSATGPINIQAIEQLLGIPITNIAGNTLTETNYGGTGQPGGGPPPNTSLTNELGIQWQNENSVRTYQAGGMVPTTGPAILHAGEYVMSNREVTQNAITSAMNDHQLEIHQQIYDLAMGRVGLEQDLLVAQQQQTILDMQRITQLSDLMDKVSSMGGGSSAVTSMEGAVAKIYELRGRYGSGNFRREQL